MKQRPKSSYVANNRLVGLSRENKQNATASRLALSPSNNSVGISKAGATTEMTAIEKNICLTQYTKLGNSVKQLQGVIDAQMRNKHGTHSELHKQGSNPKVPFFEMVRLTQQVKNKGTSGSNLRTNKISFNCDKIIEASQKGIHSFQLGPDKKVYMNAHSELHGLDKIGKSPIMI